MISQTALGAQDPRENVKSMEQRNLRLLSELQAGLLPLFFMDHHFHLREQLSDKNHSDSDVRVWQTLSNINEVRLSLPEKPLKSFC